MERVFFRIDRVGDVGSKGDFRAVVGSDRAEDIVVALLASPRFLQEEAPHAIVRHVADRDREVADLVEAAVEDGAEIRVNAMAPMDHDAYRALGGPSPRM